MTDENLDENNHEQLPHDALSAETREREEDPYEGAVPPGYDWPTHGGYLGCLLSLLVSCVVGGFISTAAYSALNYWQVVPLFATVLLTIALYVGIIIALGRVGWILGRRFYREYPQKNGPTWGESDETDDESLPKSTTMLAEEQPESNEAASKERSTTTSIEREK